MSQSTAVPRSGPRARDTAEIVLVPCADSDRVGCLIVRRAAELVADQIPEVEIRRAPECQPGSGRFVVAVDASSSCQASEQLRERGVRTGAVISAPEVLARLGLVKPGVDLRARAEELARALAEEIRGSLDAALVESRERRRYQREMSPVMQRFSGIWGRLEALPSPDGAAAPEEQTRVELLAKRSRNLFGKFDEIVPPQEWAEPHDLFQDALLCIAYACEGWVAGDAPRWEQNLEKARLQVRPLLRRLK